MKDTKYCVEINCKKNLVNKRSDAADFYPSIQAVENDCRLPFKN